MDWLSRIFDWLSEHEAGLSAAVAIMVLGGAVVAGDVAAQERRLAGQVEALRSAGAAAAAEDAHAT